MKFNIQTEPFFDTISDSGGGFTTDDIFNSLSTSLDGKDKDDDKSLTDKDDKKDKKETKNDSTDDDKDDGKDEITLDEDDSSDEEDTDDEDEEDENDEEKEKDEELELDDEADEDEKELAKIPTRGQIKAKYPNIFKEFKALDHIFYREKAFGEIFPTVKAAKAANEAVEEYGQFQSELLSGNVVGVFSKIKETNPKAYAKIASNIINSLIKVDPESYKEPAVEVIKGTLVNLNNVAAANLKRDPDNKQANQLQIACELIHQYLFQTDEVSPFKREEKEEKLSPEEEKFRRERDEFENGKFKTAHENVGRRFDSLLTKAINEHIDPTNRLTDYLKTKVMGDVKAELDRQLIEDKRFGMIVKNLYAKAKSKGYSDESVNDIITALKNKTKPILLDIIRAKRGQALKGSGLINKPKTRELSREKGSDATTRSSRNRSERNNGGKDKDEAKGPRPGESAYDYLQRALGD